MRVITSKDTNLATVDLTPADPSTNQILTLPVGVYPYSLKTSGGEDCSFSIKVFGKYGIVSVSKWIWIRDGLMNVIDKQMDLHLPSHN